MPPRKPTSDAFENAAEKILDLEGGYSDHPDDSGGKTNYGITEALAREYGYDGSMRDINQVVALDIYRRHFWDWMRLDEVHEVAPVLAEKLFDAGINVGRRQVWRWLQRVLNALNRQEKDYDDISVDGWPGPETLGALEEFIGKRGAEGDGVITKLIDSMQGHHYLTLAESRPKDESFLYGWARQRLQ